MNTLEVPDLESLDDENAERVHAIIEGFQDRLKPILSERLPRWGEFVTSRARAEAMAESMVMFANLSLEVEEGLMQMLLLKNHLDSMWDKIAARELAKPRMDRYMDKLGRLNDAIREHEALWEAKTACDAAVQLGIRANDRMQALHAVASRAAGIAMGPQ